MSPSYSIVETGDKTDFNEGQNGVSHGRAQNRDVQGGARTADAVYGSIRVFDRKRRNTTIGAVLHPASTVSGENQCEVEEVGVDAVFALDAGGSQEVGAWGAGV